MTTKNIAIEKGVAYTDTFALLTATADDLLLMQFFESGRPIAVQLATEKFGGTEGEIIINPGVDFDTEMQIAETLLLPDTNVTYKLYQIDPVTLDPTELFGGTVTVTGEASEFPAQSEMYYNGDRILRQAAGLTFTKDHDNVLLTPAAAAECTLPDARKMPGKRFRVKMTGAGSAVIKTPDTNTLINLDTIGDSCMLLAVGITDANDWTVLFA